METPRGRDKPYVLLVEDDATFRGVLARELEDLGFRAEAAPDAGTAERRIAAEAPDLIILDQRLPGRSGLELLRDLRQRGEVIPVIFLTGHGDIETAVRAIKAGAFHFLTKPCELSELAGLIQLALESRRTREATRPGVGDGDLEQVIVGRSPAMDVVRNLVRKVAPSEMPLLITGESGTGKELVARLVHERGPRAASPFVPVNCAAIPEALVEAELFGSERGAFTGADEGRGGIVEAAEGGVLFLDELAELALSAQAKLLRVLEDGSYRRVGSAAEHAADFRLVAATNRPLEDALATRGFRTDLYFRLHVLEIALPPLRERVADIPDLILHFCRLRERDAPELAEPNLHRRLSTYSWPGNVRELFNILDRSFALAEGDALDVGILEQYVRRPMPDMPGVLPDRLEDLEMMHIHSVLDRCQGNKTRAAAILGISVKTLYNKLQKE